MASGHAFNKAVDELPISWDHVELRLDAYCSTRADCESLGISVGDFVAFDPLPEFTESGHISARHLDDKAGVAALLTALKTIKESGLEPEIDCHPLFTITEEVGSGAAAALPWDVSEFVSIDIAPVAPGQQSSEHTVSVAMLDSGGPYDYHLSRQLLRLAAKMRSRCAATCSATITAMHNQQSLPVTTSAPPCWPSAVTPLTAMNAPILTASRPSPACSLRTC
jgi:putative aminopeptidase FrvX